MTAPYMDPDRLRDRANLAALLLSSHLTRCEECGGRIGCAQARELYDHAETSAMRAEAAESQVPHRYVAAGGAERRRLEREWRDGS